MWMYLNKRPSQWKLTRRPRPFFSPMAGSAHPTHLPPQAPKVVHKALVKLPKVKNASNGGDLSLASEGPRMWGRFEPRQEVDNRSKYVASDEAMAAMKDLNSMPKPVLEKRVKTWSLENLSLPERQYNLIKLPQMPQHFDRIANGNANSKARENSLMAVGAALNYAMTGGLRVSETVAMLDELILNLEIATQLLASLKAPAYVSPAERKFLNDIKDKLPAGQQPFVDPEPQDAGNHWLRSRGENFLKTSGLFKDIFSPFEEDEENGGPKPVPRTEYLEALWRGAMVREYAKKATTYAEEVQRHVNRVVGAVELFAALMHQRMDPYKGVLTPEFKQFCKEKAARDPLPDGSERPILSYLVAEFSSWVAAKPKSRDMFRQSGNPPGAQPSGSEGGKGAGVARASRRNRRRILAEEDLGGGGNSSRTRARTRSRSQCWYLSCRLSTRARRCPPVWESCPRRWIARIVVTTGTTTGPQGSARGKTHRGGRTNPRSLGAVAPASPIRTRRRMASAPRTAMEKSNQDEHSWCSPHVSNDWRPCSGAIDERALLLLFRTSIPNSFPYRELRKPALSNIQPVLKEISLNRGNLGRLPISKKQKKIKPSKENSDDLDDFQL